MEVVRQLLTQAFNPSFLEIIDETTLHYGHQGHQSGQAHLKIKIEAQSLKGLSLLTQHRKIYQVIGHLIGSSLHAVTLDVL